MYACNHVLFSGQSFLYIYKTSIFQNWLLLTNTPCPAAHKGVRSGAQRGCGVRSEKTEKIDLISFDMIIKKKVVKFECTKEHSNISFYFHSFTPRNSVQMCMNTSTIFVGEQIWSLFVFKKNAILIFHWLVWLLL